AMYRALEAVARRTGRKLALVQCGWFANDHIAKAFADGARAYAPGVRSLFTDGKDAVARQRSWAGADLFVSLSDNVQETFGLAPVEAMAAGLPAVVSDWNGYKDTVRDGIDGFRIATFMPPPGQGTLFALQHEAETATYDQYGGLACRTVSVDHAALEERLALLVTSPELRRKLGGAGRERARAHFDWAVVYRRYKELWAELAAIRRRAAAEEGTKALLAKAPRAAAARLDPYRAFAHYATHLITGTTLLAAAEGADAKVYAALVEDALFSYLPYALPNTETAGRILGALAASPMTAADLARDLGLDPGQTIISAAILAKMGLVRLGG
ncbi:MAG: glycosyltransferase, partial [Alphaproteobacteria bacterium]